MTVSICSNVLYTHTIVDFIILLWYSGLPKILSCVVETLLLNARGAHAETYYKVYKQRLLVEYLEHPPVFLRSLEYNIILELFSCPFQACFRPRQSSGLCVQVPRSACYRRNMCTCCVKMPIYHMRKSTSGLPKIQILCCGDTQYISRHYHACIASFPVSPSFRAINTRA